MILNHLLKRLGIQLLKYMLEPDIGLDRYFESIKMHINSKPCRAQFCTMAHSLWDTVCVTKRRCHGDHFGWNTLHSYEPCKRVDVNGNPAPSVWHCLLVLL